MKASFFLLQVGVCAALLAASGCNRDRMEAANGVRQTKFPGEVTAGGGTSGQVLANSAKATTEGTYSGGTPGIAGGAGGNTGGAATPSTVRETGQGPSAGTSQPSSLGRPGATLPPGDMGKPPTPAPGSTMGGQATNRDPTPPATSGKAIDSKQRPPAGDGR